METKQLYLPMGHPNRPATKISKVTGVVVHWTANEAKGANAVANRNYFGRAFKLLNGKKYESDGVTTFRSASAHLNVDDIRLVEVLPWKKGEAEIGYHVGATSYVQGICNQLSTSYPNNSTIGLEICVNADGDFKKAYANGIQVIAMMLKEHGLGIDNLYRHFDITGKLCPAFHTQDSYAKKYLNTTADIAWNEFKQSVYEAMQNEEDSPMTKEEKLAFDQLKSIVVDQAKTITTLSGRVTELEDENKKISAPKWFVKEFGSDNLNGIISEPNGSEEFWRTVAINLRLKNKK